MFFLRPQKNFALSVLTTKHHTAVTCSWYFIFQDPVRSAVIDSCIRVTDNGRESIQRKVRKLVGVSILYFLDD